MAGPNRREHFVPVRCTDLIDVLAADRGVRTDRPLTDDEKSHFRRFAELVIAQFHREYHSRLQRLKDAYAPFDPDADTASVRPLTDEEKDLAQARLFDEFSSLLERANYERMSRDEIEREMHGASYWGIDMDVDWSVFDQVELYHRGGVMGRRTKRHPVLFWKKSELPVPTWLRMVLILKQAPHKRLGPDGDTEHIFLKLFKDIPRMDLEMLLPGTRIRMSLWSRGKLGASIAGSIGYVAWKLSQYSLAVLKLGLTALYGPLALILGYAYKTWAGFTTTRQTYMLQLTQSLYYQNLDNNAGVLYRLLDEAEEQECREVILAYFYLWRYAVDRAWSAENLDAYIELDLEGKLGIAADFEIGDALDKLNRLHLLVKEPDGYRVEPIDKAIELLEERCTSTPAILPAAPAALPEAVGV